MRVLLDTHTFLWFQTDSRDLSVRAKSLIEDADNEVLLSVASVWEMAIKISLRKLELDVTLEDFVLPELSDNAFDLLPIEVPHLARVAAMPFHHRDPFDRLLAAQCLTLNVPIVSRGGAFDEYRVERIW